MVYPPMGKSNPAPISRKYRLQVILVVLAIIVGISLAGYKTRHLVYPKRFGAVIPGQLYRSGQLSRFLIESTLKKHSIRHIIDLTAYDGTEPDQRAELEASQRLGISHHRFQLRGDGTGDIESYASALEVIVKARAHREPVLVHCAAGSQRTGGTIAIYRLIYQGWSREQVLEELQSYGWSRREDQTLVRFLDRHWDELLTSLGRRGILPQTSPEHPYLSDFSPIDESITSTLND